MDVSAWADCRAEATQWCWKGSSDCGWKQEMSSRFGGIERGKDLKMSSRGTTAPSGAGQQGTWRQGSETIPERAMLVWILRGRREGWRPHSLHTREITNEWMGGDRWHRATGAWWDSYVWFFGEFGFDEMAVVESRGVMWWASTSQDSMSARAGRRKTDGWSQLKANESWMWLFADKEGCRKKCLGEERMDKASGGSRVDRTQGRGVACEWPDRTLGTEKPVSGQQAGPSTVRSLSVEILPPITRDGDQQSQECFLEDAPPPAPRSFLPRVSPGINSPLLSPPASLSLCLLCESESLLVWTCLSVPN